MAQVQPQDIRPAEAGRFVFGQALGKGQSSQVLEVRDTITGRRDLVAKLSDKYELLQEAMVLKALQGLETFPDFIGLFAGDQPETQRLFGAAALSWKFGRPAKRCRSHRCDTNRWDPSSCAAASDASVELGTWRFEDQEHGGG